MRAGFSLIELLVLLFISSALLTLMASFLRANVAARYNASLQIEAQQGVRAILAMVTQELRQAGACLPRFGQFIALDGTDSGTQDTLTLRIGQTDPDTLACVKAGTTADAADGSTTLTVLDGNGALFAEAELVYVTPNGASGDFYTIATTTATTILLNEPLVGAHQAGTGIYAVEERTYAISTLSGQQVLTMAIDGDTAQPLAGDVEAFNVEYLLAPCPPCTPVDLPIDDTEWRQVRQVTIATTVRSHKKHRNGQFVYESGQANIRPRNLL